MRAQHRERETHLAAQYRAFSKRKPHDASGRMYDVAGESVGRLSEDKVGRQLEPGVFEVARKTHKW